ncbi:hypothetical protein [uncultured Fibrobacter sp.]|jgi:hypothetical protein|uniref:hypothetical protein n=1 Tax=uncultured Fibrobacter sp. TaxID=261512 RepID=UPI0025EC946F|nr:hypothetical protein [uncultured Fibrobacter sp.]
MDRKKLIPLFLSSAMLLLWACAEGDIMKADDSDEMIASKSDQNSKNAISDEEFLQPYLDYCNSKEGKKKGCEAEIIKSSSSKKDEKSSASEEESSSSKVNSSSSGKGSSSSAKSSSSGKGSSSSTKSSSSGKSSSSSEPAPVVSGKCDLIKPDVVHVGDEIIWRYLPDDNSIGSAKYEWDVNYEVEKSILDGELTGVGLPELMVKFTTKGLKYGPTLTFDGIEFDCENLTVVDIGDDPVSSSSVAESSSSKKESSSSSAPRSSSSSTPMGYCAVSKHEIFVGETVDWYIVDSEGNELEGRYNWFDLGISGELVEGEKSGKGSTRITVRYTQPGTSIYPMGYWNGKYQIDCSRNELDEGNLDPLLVIKAKVESSSSSEEEPEESSSSTTTPRSSSSSKATTCAEDPTLPGCESIDL